MNWIKQLLSRRRLYSDLSDEIQEHLAEKIEELVASGMSREEATCAARREFGNATLIEERGREVWNWSWLETLGQDVRYGFRQLRRNPGFTIIAVLTLALGIGVDTTLFTAFDAVALKPLPVADSRNVFRLVRTLASGAQGDVQYGFSYSEFVQYRKSNSLSGLIAASWPVSLSAVLPGTARNGSVTFGEPQAVHAQFVSWNYFAVLGALPALGRTFLSEENRQPAVAVLSFPFWQKRFNSDPAILGKTLKLNGPPLTVEMSKNLNQVDIGGRERGSRLETGV
jgi:hypothetical protein